jgi:hypothetical protein
MNQVPARYAGGRLPLSAIDTIVIHQLARGSRDAGPRYVSDPGRWIAIGEMAGEGDLERAWKRGGRRMRSNGTLVWIPRPVSWHFTIHRQPYAFQSTQHLPISRIGWQAPPVNGHSLGFEFDGPEGAPWQSEMLDEGLRVLLALRPFLPALERLRSHRSVSPARRRDPGPDFPWERFEGLGLEIVA